MRKAFTTNIDETIQSDFKEKCQYNKVKMNDILEVLMKSYIDGKIGVEIQTNYNVSYSNYKEKYENQLLKLIKDKYSELYTYEYKLYKNQIKNYNDLKKYGSLKELINTSETLANRECNENIEIIGTTETCLKNDILIIRGYHNVVNNIIDYLLGVKKYKYKHTFEFNTYDYAKTFFLANNSFIKQCYGCDVEICQKGSKIIFEGREGISGRHVEKVISLFPELIGKSFSITNPL